MVEYRWNGVGLTTPALWEPSALERDGFLLEHKGVPMCELKWRVVHGTFSFDKHLKRLSKGHKGVDIQGVPLEETPAVWQESVETLAQSGLRLQSFIWKTAIHKGIGAALHNKATGLAGLVQFFIHDEKLEGVAATALASFRDFSGGKTIPWTMFGLTARIPAGYVLDTFAFKPGHYRVKYWLPKSVKQGNKLPPGKGPGSSLIFDRYAPASVLLKQTSLNDWMSTGVDDLPKGFSLPDTSSDVVQWDGVQKTSMLRKVLRREVSGAGRFWTPDSGNAILGVRVNGVVPVSSEQFNTICESYGVI